jgi:hypothetical protein
MVVTAVYDYLVRIELSLHAGQHKQHWADAAAFRDLHLFREKRSESNPLTLNAEPLSLLGGARGSLLGVRGALVTRTRRVTATPALAPQLEAHLKVDLGLTLAVIANSRGGNRTLPSSIACKRASRNTQRAATVTHLPWRRHRVRLTGRRSTAATGLGAAQGSTTTHHTTTRLTTRRQQSHTHTQRSRHRSEAT